MSLWMLLLIVLLAVTSVVFFNHAINATDPKAKNRSKIIATVALVAVVGIIVMGVLRGRRATAASAVVTKKGKRVKFVAEDLNLNDEFNTNELDNNEFNNDEFLGDFDDLPRPPGIPGPAAKAPKAGGAAVDSTTLFAGQ